MGFMRHPLIPQSESSPERTVPWSTIRHGPWDLQFQLGPSIGRAPGFQARTDVRGTLPHATHSPMPRLATRFDNLRIDATAVVTEAQTQACGVVGDLDFNALRPRVPHRVCQGLVPDPKCVVPHHRVELAPLSFYH